MNTFSNSGDGGVAIDVGRMQARNNNFARRTVDLVDGATIDLGTLSHIAIKGTVKTAAGDRPGNRIAVLLHDRRTGSSLNAVAAADDTFRFPEASLAAGHYHVSIPNTPAFRILSLEAKGAKMSNGELLVEDNSDVQLSLLIGRKSAVEVVGFVTKDDAALVGALVLLIPKSTSVGATTYRDQSDSDGSFTLGAVSAGTYLALAVENGHDFAFGEPAVLKPYLAGAQTVTVSEASAPPPLKIKAQSLVSG